MKIVSERVFVLVPRRLVCAFEFSFYDDYVSILNGNPTEGEGKRSTYTLPISILYLLKVADECQRRQPMPGARISSPISF